jgi:hypothetical protein
MKKLEQNQMAVLKICVYAENICRSFFKPKKYLQTYFFAFQRLLSIKAFPVSALLRIRGGQDPLFTTNVEATIIQL